LNTLERRRSSLAVFISYNHEDREFVDRLATSLVKNKTHVWLDRWEITVGQSLISKVQEAIQEAGALLVVLSKASVKSEWCKRELNAALMRELDEKRVLILPVRVDGCKAPPFLSDKLYADFRGDFDAGLREVLNGIASVTEENLGRTELDSGFYNDWSIEWDSDKPEFRILLVEPKKGDPCTIFSQAVVKGNAAAAEVRNSYRAEGVDWLWRKLTLELVAQTLERAGDQARVLVKTDQPELFRMQFGDPRQGILFNLVAEVRRLGSDHGHDILVNVGNQIRTACRTSSKRFRPPTPDEIGRIARVLQSRYVDSAG
jgi:hypothetical protein